MSKSRPSSLQSKYNCSRSIMIVNQVKTCDTPRMSKQSTTLVYRIAHELFQFFFFFWNDELFQCYHFVEPNYLIPTSARNFIKEVQSAKIVRLYVSKIHCLDCYEWLHNVQHYECTNDFVCLGQVMVCEGLTWSSWLQKTEKDGKITRKKGKWRE